MKIMKAMKALLFTILAVSTITLTANSDTIRVEPGPVMKMDVAAVEVTDALLFATSANLTKFVKAGNQVVDVTRQNWQPGVTIYNFSRKQCSQGGIAGRLCLGGANLEVVIRETRTGSILKVTATSKVTLYR